MVDGRTYGTRARKQETIFDTPTSGSGGARSPYVRRPLQAATLHTEPEALLVLHLAERIAHRLPLSLTPCGAAPRSRRTQEQVLATLACAASRAS